MATTQLAPGTLIEKPELEGGAYGIAVGYCGDDGEMLALGHHSERRTLAAFNQHARAWCGLPNIACDRSADAQDWLDAIETKWAVFRTPDPEQGEDPECTFYAHWCAEGTPGALPVMWLPAT